VACVPAARALIGFPFAARLYHKHTLNEKNEHDSPQAGSPILSPQRVRLTEEVPLPPPAVPALLLRPSPTLRTHHRSRDGGQMGGTFQPKDLRLSHRKKHTSWEPRYGIEP
jgi:hypothetical protein